MNLSDFFRGVAGMKTSAAVSNALSVGTDTGGGFSVPSILMPGILGALVPVSSLLTAGVGIVMLEEGAKSYVTAGVGNIPVASWRLEAGTLATSDATFRAVTATPKSLAFQFRISRELLADGQGIETALFQAIAQSFAKELDRAGLRGPGTDPEPRGLLNTVGVQSVTNGQDGAELTSYANMFAGVQGILQADGPMPTSAICRRAAWLSWGN
jgi:HK97 family phage major capsid protein